MKELTNIKNGRYNMRGDLFFNTDQGDYTISQKDALEIAYTLFDSAGFSYAELEKLEEKIEGVY